MVVGMVAARDSMRAGSGWLRGEGRGARNLRVNILPALEHPVPTVVKEPAYCRPFVVFPM